MKRLYFLLFSIVFLLGSCSFDDDGVNFHYTPLEIVNADLPESFDFGGTYTISVNILRPDDCTLIDSFDIRRFTTDSTNVRTVTAIGILLDKDDCTALDQEIQDTFEFQVIYTNPYIFRFFSGSDENGGSQFIEIEVPVNNHQP